MSQEASATSQIPRPISPVLSLPSYLNLLRARNFSCCGRAVALCFYFAPTLDTMGPGIQELTQRIPAIFKEDEQTRSSWPDLSGNCAQSTGVQPKSIIMPDLNDLQTFLDFSLRAMGYATFWRMGEHPQAICTGP